MKRCSASLAIREMQIKTTEHFLTAVTWQSQEEGPGCGHAGCSLVLVVDQSCAVGAKEHGLRWEAGGSEHQDRVR